MIYKSCKIIVVDCCHFQSAIVNVTYLLSNAKFADNSSQIWAIDIYTDQGTSLGGLIYLSLIVIIDMAQCCVPGCIKGIEIQCNGWSTDNVQ